MISCRNMLMSGQTGPIVGTPATNWFECPEIRADAAVETVYRITIEGVTGAPTSAFVTAEFQIAQRTTAGGSGSSGAVTDATPVWVSIDANNYRDLLPDGDWPTRIWRVEDVSPIVVTRRIKGGGSHRLRIKPTLGGGTTPGIVMSVECEVRYL